MNSQESGRNDAKWKGLDPHTKKETMVSNFIHGSAFPNSNRREISQTDIMMTYIQEAIDFIDDEATELTENGGSNQTRQ